MVELRTLHVTDIHDNWRKYAALATFIAEKKGNEGAIDALAITGDFIEGDVGNEEGTVHRIFGALERLSESGELTREQAQFEAFMGRHARDGKLDIANLDDVARGEFEIVSGAINTKQSRVVADVVTESYRQHAEWLAKLEVPVLGVLGNHDLTLGYELLRDQVAFLERTNGVTVKGRTGIEFAVQGDLNTFEVPSMYIKLAPLLGDYFIPYQSGHSVSDLTAQGRQLEGEISTGRAEFLERIAKKEKPKYSAEELRKMDVSLEHLVEARRGVVSYYQTEVQRLGNLSLPADIYLTHKLPHCKKARSDIEGGLSDLTVAYAAKAGAVYGGHFHDGQIGYKTIENVLKQTSTETTIIDGTEVPVFYLDQDEPWELNPGTKYALITEYDAGKKIEQVVIYEFVELQVTA